MDNTLLTFGIVLFAAAIAGGGFKALGYEIPVIGSLRRQIALGIFGIGLIFFGRWELIYPVLNPVEMLTKTQGPITIESGVEHTIPLSLQQGGAVEVTVRDMAQHWPEFAGTRGQPGQDSLYVRVCSSLPTVPCAERQLGADQTLRQEVPAGGVNIRFFNFSTSPAQTFTVLLTYPGKRRFSFVDR